jgi:hypothetical protein
LISTILDTKGLEETLHVQATSSYSGCCLCNVGKGYHYGLNTKYMDDHRNAKPIEHFLRNKGMSQFCCNPNEVENSNKQNIINNNDESLICKDSNFSKNKRNKSLPLTNQ